MDTQAEAEPSHLSGEHFLKRMFASFRSLFKRDLDQGLQDLIESREDAELPLTNEERELIEAVLRFSSITADDACVPRSDIVHLSKTDTFEEVVGTFKESGYSRLPVCAKDLDEVVGFVTLKDLFQYVAGEEEFTLKNVMRPCTFVPESFAISAVLDEMRNHAVQMAVVVDEYGGTTGLITVKDIMEELVGDLDDENEQEVVKGVIELIEGRYALDARVEIEDLEDGLRQSWCVPEEGATFNLESGCRLVVTQADGRRVQKVTYIPKSFKAV